MTVSIPTPAPDQRPLHPAKRAALVLRIYAGWQDQALCRKFPDDDWFPAPATSHVVAELVEVCQHCPAHTSCLAAALAMGEEHGIWGGTTEADRREALSDFGRGAHVPQVLQRLLNREPKAGDSQRGEAA